MAANRSGSEITKTAGTLFLARLRLVLKTVRTETLGFLALVAYRFAFCSARYNDEIGINYLFCVDFLPHPALFSTRTCPSGLRKRAQLAEINVGRAIDLSALLL